MRRNMSVLCVLALCAASCTKGPLKPKKKPSTYTGPKLTLETKFKPASHVLTEEMTINQTITAERQTQPVDQSILVSGTVQVEAPDAAGEQKIRFTCGRVKQSISMMGQTLSFDSDGPASAQHPKLAAMLQPLVGWGATLTGRDGKFTKVEGIESLVARVSASTPDSAQMAAQLRQMMEPFMKELLTKHWGELIPKTPIGPGDEWKATMNVENVPILGKASIDAWCLLQDVEEKAGCKVAVIDFAAQTTFRDKTLDTSLFGGPAMSMKVGKMSITYTGTARFDLDIGLSTHLKMAGDLEGDMSVTGPQGQKADVDVKAKITYENTLRQVPSN